MNKRFDTLLQTMPVPVAGTLSELAELPDIAQTRQVIWALVLARLSMLSFLFKVTKLRPREINAAEVNRIHWKLSLYKTEKALQRILPGDAFNDAMIDYNVLLENT